MDFYSAIQRETKSRVFGDQLEDFIMLAKKLGPYRLSRVKANELNIFARGGVMGM